MSSLWGDVYWLILRVWAFLVIPLGLVMTLYSQADHLMLGGHRFSSDERWFFVAFSAGAIVMYVLGTRIGRLFFRR